MSSPVHQRPDPTTDCPDVEIVPSVRQRGVAPPDPEAVVICSTCGRQCKAKHNYCGGCGARLREHCAHCLQPLWDNEPCPLPRPHPPIDLKPMDFFEKGGP